MIKKEWSYALSILSLTTSLVAADQESAQQNMPRKPMGVTTQPTGVITPPVGPRVEDGANVIITADFIYWKPHQDGLEFAQSSYKSAGAITGVTLPEGTISRPKSSFEPGFKVGLGVEFEHDGWDLYANYTWLAPTTNSTTASVDDPTTTEAVWTDYIYIDVGDLVEQASGSWKLNYDVVDLELGRNFFISDYLTLRPHFGLKGAWLKQRNTVSYALTTLIDASLTNADLRMTQKYWGVGIRGGLDTVWHFCKDFGMYGDLALSALWGNYKNKRTDTFRNPDGTITGQSLNADSGFHTVTPVLELGLGLVYMTWFHDDEYMFDIRAGWEEQVWFNTNRFFDNASRPSGDFTTQGLTLKVGFAF